MTWYDLSSAFGYGTKLTSTQMQQLRDNITALANGDSGAPNIQTAALQSQCVTTGKIADDDVTEAKIAANAVAQSEIKNTSTTDSHNLAGWQTVTLTGADYGFLPQIHAQTPYSAFFRWNDSSTGYETSSTSYIQTCETKSGQSGYYVSLRMRYINSSGEIFWMFALMDKKTEKIIRWNVGENHPCFGNSKDPEILPHPFIFNYDKNKHKILMANPSKEQLKEFTKLAIKQNISLNEFIIHNCKFDFSRSAKWPDKPVTVGLTELPIIQKVGAKANTIKRIIPKLDYINVMPLKLKK